MRVLRVGLFGALGFLGSGCQLGGDSAVRAGEVDETARQQVREALHGITSRAWQFRAPAGQLPTSRETVIDGVKVAVLPNGRLLSPAGVEVNVTAPKPYGLALSPDGKTVATINSGASKFSVSLIRNLDTPAPSVQRVDVNATFMGVVFSADSTRFYASGGENGNVWVGETATGNIVGSVNLNAGRPLTGPLNPKTNPPGRFKGTFPGNMVLARDGRHLYVVDQGSFRVFVIDTNALVVGTDAQGLITEPNNFAAVVNSVAAGRYPYAIARARNQDKLFVANVGVFQYTHLRPADPTGDSNVDYPLCYPAAGYPSETTDDTTLKIKPVDPRNLPATLQDPEGIRCGYVTSEITYTVPGLGDPNVAESSSVYVMDGTNAASPRTERVLKPGRLVGEIEDGIRSYSGSHPNAIAVGSSAVYVSNGNNDTISVYDRRNLRKVRDVSLSVLNGPDSRLKGVQPVGLALSPDENWLYVAEVGLNAIGVLRLTPSGAYVAGHIPVGWWPSSVQVSADGKTLYVANARGRGAGPSNDFPPDNNDSPKHSTMGSVSIVKVPNAAELHAHTERVLVNNGFLAKPVALDHDNPVPVRFGIGSRQIKHVIFINKENSTHDQMFGDITATRRGVAVNGEPRYSLGTDASPNHHELALSFAFSDNFFLEPAVSSDGHRWLTANYTTEFEETHWPASYGGQRRDSGDDPAVFTNYPGRLGFTDADGSPDPHDYNEHGGILLHLARNDKSFINFGNGYEFAIVDEDFGTEPTGIREHVNVPMEKVVRDNSDHLYPNYNTHIPDAPLPEDPTRFSRYGRFKQVFDDRYVDRAKGECKLPSYVDLYYPNDHGGGARDINPNGPDWSYKRFVQDNDAALGLTVDLISHSPCWKDTVIFVVEDDPQNGLDHVDGYRSIFLAIGPWVKREHVSKTHMSLASIFKTTELILGVPPLNQYDAAATDLRDLFTDKPDFSPYEMQQIAYAMNANPLWRKLTRGIDFGKPDSDEVKLRAAILRSEGLPRPLPRSPARKAKAGAT